MRLGRFELGVSKLNGKVAPMEFSYMRGCCDCTIISFGWFYFTILRGECRTAKPQTDFDRMIDDLNDKDFPGYEWGYDDDET